jgi:hypothetical protein
MLNSMKHWPLLYLETSIFGFYYDKEPRNTLRREAVRALLHQVDLGLLNGVTSPATIEELADTPGRYGSDLLELVSEVKVLELDETEVMRLASCYLNERIIPADYSQDARHAAYATVGGAAIIVTLNLRHLANEWAERRINAVNLREGYPLVRIRTPEEVLRYEE